MRVSTAAAVLALLLAAPFVAAQECPIAPATTPLNFTGVASACGAETPEAEFCGTCTCGLVAAFLPAFAAANLTIDAADPASYPVDAAAGVVSGCAVAYASDITAAGVDLQSIAALGSCNFTDAETLPTCLVDLLSAPDVEASQGDATPLTVGAIAAGADGVTFTLSGELNSVSELVDAMLASEALLAALEPAQAEALAGAAGADLDAVPALVDYVGTLINPVSAPALIEQLAAAAAGPAPALPACPLAPAATPLDFSGAAAGCAPGGADFCGACTCALVSSFMPAFEQEGLMIDPANPAAYPVDAAAGVIAGCTVAYADSLTAAGVDIASIAALGDCTFTDAATLPTCVVELLSAPAAPAPEELEAPAPAPEPMPPAPPADTSGAAGAAASVAILAAVAVGAML